MNVIVCVKQIPDPALPGAQDPNTLTLKRDGKLILDESDSYGVEMALQLVDAAGGGEVSIVSMAPNGEVSGMRTALAMGAAKGVLVSDPELAGSDVVMELWGFDESQLERLQDEAAKVRGRNRLDQVLARRAGVGQPPAAAALTGPTMEG